MCDIYMFTVQIYLFMYDDVCTCRAGGNVNSFLIHSVVKMCIRLIRDLDVSLT